MGRSSGGGNFEPTEQIELLGLNETWPSQLWRLERLGKSRFRIVNLWEPHTGALTNTTNGPQLGIAGSPEHLQSWKIPRA